MELFFDTETSDMVKWKLPINDPSQPWMVQIGAILSDEDMIYAELNLLIQPDGRTIAPGAFGAHGISEEMAELAGVDERYALITFASLYKMADVIVCHNIDFDSKILDIAMDRQDPFIPYNPIKKMYFCTMKQSTDMCKIKKNFGDGYKWPKLQELHYFLFKENFVGAHDAMNDVRATRRCYYEMMRREDENKT